MSKLCQFGGRPWSYLFKKFALIDANHAPLPLPLADLSRLKLTVIKSRPTSTRCCLIAANNFPIPIRKMSQKPLDINAEKDRYLQMPLIDKRKTYRCGSKYVELSNIPTWEEYAQKLNLRSSSNQRFKVKSALNKKVSPLVSDITTLEVDAIVNAANKTLLGGGGVDGAIHRGAGRSLKEECSSLNGCQTGEAKITGGYLLPAKYVIHTVGPVGENESKLKSCYESCLEYVKKNNLKTIAFPCISTGIYGYPNEAAAHVALNTVRSWLEKDDNADNVDRIIFCLFLPVDIQIYEQLMLEYFPL